MLPGEMAANGEGVETREQRRQREREAALARGDEENNENDGEGHGGGPGGPDGGDSGDGDSGDESPSDPEDPEDQTLAAFKRQNKAILILAKSIKEMVKKKDDGEYYVDQTTGIRKVRKKISPPTFKGSKGERPEAHLLRAKDWFDSSGIVRNQDKVYNFKHTLDGKAREWYADMINTATITPRWTELETAFSRYFSTQGRSIKHLHDSWRRMSFNPKTDDIEEFIRDAQECAKQLEYDDHVIINMLKAVMPREIYGTLYYMDDLAEVINFCKDYFSRNPKDQDDEITPSPDKGATGITPFSKIKAVESPGDIGHTLNQISESLYKLDFNQRPYKPTIYPQGRGRGRGRGNGRFQGRGNQRSYQPYNQNQPRRGRGRGGFRGKPRGGQKFDKSPTKRNPRENSKTKDSDKDRCRYCREIGHWVKDCPQKKRDDAKDADGASNNFSNLNEIAQDFYGTPEVFHGITEIYKDTNEEEEQEHKEEKEREDPFLSLNY